MNHEAGISYFWNSFSSRGVPISPANIPRWMSEGESSPPYEPSHPPTASMSTPKTHLMSLGMSISFAAGAAPSAALRGCGSGFSRRWRLVQIRDHLLGGERIGVLRRHVEDRTSVV